MRSRFVLTALLSLLIAGFGVWAVAGDGDSAPAATDDPDDSRVVVLELFTSEGCSSCPPADRLLQRLADEPDLAGRIAPLSLHVDYWNYLGWRDPYSSERWSHRQKTYAKNLSGRVYTPQLVVDGRAEAVGSQEGEVRVLLREALSRPAQARVDLAPGEPGESAWPIQVSAELLQRAGTGEAELWIAVTENDLKNSVSRGENAGRTLTHDGVVRRLERILTLSADHPSETRELELLVQPEWKVEDLGLVAFLQEPGSMRILGADAVIPHP